MTIILHQDSFHLSFSDNRDSVFVVKEEEQYTVYTLDNLGFNESLERTTEQLNPLAGPFHMEDGKKGNVLAVTIVGIEITRNVGMSSSGILPEFLTAQHRKEVMGEPVTYWVIDRQNCSPVVSGKLDETICLSAAPMIGCIRCADPTSKMPMSSTEADEVGGNLDFKKIGIGSTVFLPVVGDGALFYLGDVHYQQAAGEVAGTGIEISAAVTFSVRLLKEVSFGKLHVHAEEHMYFLGVDENLNDAIKKAYSNALEFLITRLNDETRARIIVGHASNSEIVKLGNPNIIAVGIHEHHTKNMAE